MDSTGVPNKRMNDIVKIKGGDEYLQSGSPRPQTPDPHQNLSNRKWKKITMQWRWLLFLNRPPVPPPPADTNLKGSTPPQRPAAFVTSSVPRPAPSSRLGSVQDASLNSHTLSPLAAEFIPIGRTLWPPTLVWLGGIRDQDLPAISSDI